MQPLIYGGGELVTGARYHDTGVSKLECMCLSYFNFKLNTIICNGFIFISYYCVQIYVKGLYMQLSLHTIYLPTALFHTILVILALHEILHENYLSKPFKSAPKVMF